MANDGPRLEDRRGGSDCDQDHHGRHDGNRRGRMQDDAQRAMVCIAFERMHVRHLGHGQQRQQGQTQQRSDRESAWLPAAVPAEMCLESCQRTIPFLKNTQNWTHSLGRGLRQKAGFASATSHTVAALVRLNC